MEKIASFEKFKKKVNIMFTSISNDLKESFEKGVDTHSAQEFLFILKYII